MNKILAYFWLIMPFAAVGQELNWKASSSIVTKYLATIGSVPSDDPSFVNEVTASRGDFYFGVWIATGIGEGKYGKTFKDDWDPYVGWIHSFGPLRYEITGIYFLVADFSHMGDDIWAVDQKISLPETAVVHPYMTLRKFGKIGAQSPEGGLFLWTGLQNTTHMKNLTIKSDISITASDGPLGKDTGLVFSKYANSIAIPLSGTLALTASFGYQIPIGHQKTANRPFNKKSQLVWGVGITYTTLKKGGAK